MHLAFLPCLALPVNFTLNTRAALRGKSSAAAPIVGITLWHL